MSGGRGGSSQLVHPCRFHTHHPDLQPSVGGGGGREVRQRMGGAQANCSGVTYGRQMRAEPGPGPTLNLPGDCALSDKSIGLESAI